MVIIAIDPSINFMGCAVFRNKKLIKGELLKPGKLGEKSGDFIAKSRVLYKKIKDMYRYYGGSKKVKIVLEIPQYWGVAGYLARESGSIYKLTFLCGMICSIDEVITYTPNDWKGQLPKRPVKARLKEIYTKINFDKLNHNVMDAIGIGHKHIFGKL